jgi:hypothetical protein
MTRATRRRPPESSTDWKQPLENRQRATLNHPYISLLLN